MYEETSKFTISKITYQNILSKNYLQITIKKNWFYKYYFGKSNRRYNSKLFRQSLFMFIILFCEK